MAKDFSFGEILVKTVLFSLIFVENKGILSSTDQSSLETISCGNKYSLFVYNRYFSAGENTMLFNLKYYNFNI